MSKITPLKAAIYAALIFASGLGTGVVTAPLLGRAFLRPPSPEHMSRHLLSKLEKRLDLTEAQVAQVKPIIDQGGIDLQAMWLETTGRVEARIAQMNSEIEPLLTSEQKKKLDQFTAEGRERMRKRKSFRPPPLPR